MVIIEFDEIHLGAAGAGIGVDRVAKIDPALLELLVCPVPTCRGRLEWSTDRLTCMVCKLQYDVTDGWPNMIPEEAQRLDDPHTKSDT